MNMNELENRVCSFIQWGMELVTDLLEGTEADDLVSTSKQDVVSKKDFILKELANIHEALTRNERMIEACNKKLLKHVVGLDSKFNLDVIYENTSLSISSLQFKSHPNFNDDFNHAAFKKRIKDCENNLKILNDANMLHFEGAGGEEHEKNKVFLQLAYYLIHAVRYLLNIITCLFCFESNKNKWAESTIHRPFFFQVPCSPQEISAIEQTRNDLKNVIEAVKKTQEALDNTLNGTSNADNTMLDEDCYVLSTGINNF